MKRLTFITLATLSLTNTIWAQSTLNSEYFDSLKTQREISTESINWLQFGPGMSGYCEEFWCHPSDPNTMLMGPDMHVSYGTWDGGESWHTTKDFDGMGYDMERVIEVVFSRQDPNFAMAIDRDGFVNISHDRGRTWQQKEDLGKCHAELAVDPTNDNIWYIGAGDFFNIKDNHRSQANPNGIILNRSEYGHIWKSSDKGESWRKITKGLPEMVDIGKIVVDPRNPKVVLAVTGHGLYRSEDEGESWVKSGNGLPNNLPRDMASYYDPTSGKYSLYIVEQSVYSPDGSGSITVSGGVYKSSDGGVNWEDITGNLAIDLTKIDSSAMMWLYRRAIGYWFGKSSDEVARIYPNLPTSIYGVFNRIRVNPNDPDEIFICNNVKHDFTFTPGDIWKTTDGGEHWNVVSRTGSYWAEKRDAEYWSERGNPLGENMTFAHLHNNIVRGECFAGVRFMEINCEGDLYINLEQQTLVSKDGGGNWHQIDDIEVPEGSGIWVGRGDSDLPGRYMLLETGIKGRMLLCSGEHGLWENVPLDGDFGEDVVGVRQLEGQIHADGAHSVSTVAVHPQNPNEIYILVFRQSHRGYLRRSTDGGKSWENISKPIDFDNPNLSSFHVFQSSLMIDPENPKSMYFCAIRQPISEVGDGKASEFNDFGVYKSYDGGYTWSFSNPGIPQMASVNRLAMDPKDSAVIYAASNKSRQEDGGLYRSESRGENWSKVTIPSEITSVNNVYIDRNNGYIYIACGDRNGGDLGGGVWRSTNGCVSWEKIFDAPYIWQVESSPVDPSIICVNSAGRRTWGDRLGILNPGAYISHDSGKSWVKANRGLGQPDKITDFKPDPYDRDVFWCALWGSGWYKATWK